MFLREDQSFVDCAVGHQCFHAPDCLCAFDLKHDAAIGVCKSSASLVPHATVEIFEAH